MKAAVRVLYLAVLVILVYVGTVNDMPLSRAILVGILAMIPVVAIDVMVSRRKRRNSHD